MSLQPIRSSQEMNTPVPTPDDLYDLIWKDAPDGVEHFAINQPRGAGWYFNLGTTDVFRFDGFFAGLPSLRYFGYGLTHNPEIPTCTIFKRERENPFSSERGESVQDKPRMSEMDMLRAVTDPKNKGRIFNAALHLKVNRARRRGVIIVGESGYLYDYNKGDQDNPYNLLEHDRMFTTARDFTLFMKKLGHPEFKDVPVEPEEDCLE